MEVSYNADKTLKLEVESSESIEAVKDFKFKVIEVASGKVILEDTFRGTKLIWNSKNSLKGFLYVGTVQQGNENPDSICYQIITLGKDCFFQESLFLYFTRISFSFLNSRNR